MKRHQIERQKHIEAQREGFLSLWRVRQLTKKQRRLRLLCQHKNTDSRS